MNRYTKLAHLLSRHIQRGVGKTENIVKFVKEIDGILLVHHFSEAKRITKEYNLNNIASVHGDLDLLQGNPKALILDQDAMLDLLHSAGIEIEQLEKDNLKLQGKLNQIANIVGN